MGSTRPYLEQWKQSLCPQVAVGGLFARNAVVHKWKAPFRSLILREGLCWRTQDLLEQAQLLHEAGHTLGSRILIRSAIETLAILIHLNQLTQNVLDGTLDYFSFDARAKSLLLGSRDGSTSLTSVNIMTVLNHCEKRYPGIVGIYSILSECAHPNYEGVCTGYSTVDHEQFDTNFSNRWSELWSDRHDSLMELVCKVFESEYNAVWDPLFEQFEKWIEANDARLEAEKHAV